MIQFSLDARKKRPKLILDCYRLQGRQFDYASSIVLVHESFADEYTMNPTKINERHE